MSSALRCAAATLLILAALILGAPALSAQGSRGRKICPYCRLDPELMKRAGIVSHGPFEFAAKTTTEVQAALPFTTFIWIESAHTRLGSDLPRYTISMDERRKIRAELTELAKILPTVNPKVRVLDPWLRAHLFAWRAEKHYRDFQELLGVEDSSFPGRRPDNYMGEGRYLGEKGKYEILLHHRMSSNMLFLKNFLGVQQARAKWHNYPELDHLLISLAATGSGGLTGKDTQVHNGMVHLLTHVFLCGYRHYSYDIPVWFPEGLAHWFTWRNSPSYPFYCIGEATAEIKLRGSRWRFAMRKRVVGQKDVPLPTLMRHRSYGSFRENDHLSAFSKVDYMINGFEDGKQRLRIFVNHIKGRLRPDGFPDGADMNRVFREAFKKAYAKTMISFDESWREWVLATYPTR